jgi:hypothetical protein
VLGVASRRAGALMLIAHREPPEAAGRGNLQ